jgi:hypothetical protein
LVLVEQAVLAVLMGVDLLMVLAELPVVTQHLVVTYLVLVVMEEVAVVMPLITEAVLVVVY